MSIDRREFLTYSAAAGVIAEPVALAATPTNSHADRPRVASAENGLPIPDDWKGDEERFLMAWWAASFFFGQAAMRTLGFEPVIWTPANHIDDYRVREFHAAAVCQYTQHFYEAHALVPFGYHAIDRIAWGPGTGVSTPQFAVCFPFGCDEEHQAPIPPHSMETQHWLNEETKALDAAYYAKHPEKRPATTRKRQRPPA